MQCERARELISPHIDGELTRAEERELAAHLEGCRTCAAIAADFRTIGTGLAAMGRERASTELTLRVCETLAEAAEVETRPSLIQAIKSRGLLPSSGLMRQAAALLIACALSAFATYWIMGTLGQREQLQQEVLTAHVRSLLQESPIQIASSDQHTVKPWFAGRVDFAPDVRDLSDEGFPLLGGRLDYVAGRRVGAIVYKRRQHVINVFVWPISTVDNAGPSLVVRNGYNLVSWTRNGVSYWAISDVNAAELQRLQALL